jgi:hypothetical protein
MMATWPEFYKPYVVMTYSSRLFLMLITLIPLNNDYQRGQMPKGSRIDYFDDPTAFSLTSTKPRPSLMSSYKSTCCWCLHGKSSYFDVNVIHLRFDYLEAIFTPIVPCDAKENLSTRTRCGGVILCWVLSSPLVVVTCVDVFSLK